MFFFLEDIFFFLEDISFCLDDISSRDKKASSTLKKLIFGFNYYPFDLLLFHFLEKEQLLPQLIKNVIETNLNNGIELKNIINDSILKKKTYHK